MHRYYECIGISFTEEDRELKKQLLECCFRVRDVDKYFINVFDDLTALLLEKCKDKS